ncbi:MAG: pitrilysin family protein [Thermodesulfovibrionales bacterium]
MRRLRSFLIFFLVLLPLYAHADIKEFILENGLKVIISEDHKVPLSTFQIWYKVGSRDETSGRTGLSHFLEHMMFKGTPKYGSKMFSRIIQRNGGIDNAFTTKDYTMYFQTLSSDRIGLSIDLESDRMTNLIMNPNETISERNVVLEERRMRYEDDPQNSLFERVVATAIMTHPYRRPVIGWMSDISSLQREDLYNYYRKYYAPDNAFIVIAGDVNPDETMEKIRSAFGDIKKNNPQKAPATKEPEQRGEKRIYLKKEAEVPSILIAYHAPSFPDRDSFALDVLSTVLSGGKSARLYKSLIYEKKLALEAGADYSGMYIDPFLFFLYASAAPGRDIADVERALFSEIERIKETPPSEREVQKAKNQIEASFVFGQDSLYMQAMMIGKFEILGGWRLRDKYLEGIRNVTPEDVQEVARKYLTEDNRTVGILIPIKNSK